MIKNIDINSSDLKLPSKIAFGGGLEKNQAGLLEQKLGFKKVANLG